jgi:hypothetical protein
LEKAVEECMPFQHGTQGSQRLGAGVPRMAMHEARRVALGSTGRLRGPPDNDFATRASSRCPETERWPSAGQRQRAEAWKPPRHVRVIRFGTEVLPTERLDAAVCTSSQQPAASIALRESQTCHRADI